MEHLREHKRTLEQFCLLIQLISQTEILVSTENTIGVRRYFRLHSPIERKNNQPWLREVNGPFFVTLRLKTKQWLCVSQMSEPSMGQGYWQYSIWVHPKKIYQWPHFYAKGNSNNINEPRRQIYDK